MYELKEDVTYINKVYCKGLKGTLSMYKFQTRLNFEGGSYIPVAMSQITKL
jgi:hypothetical protein